MNEPYKLLKTAISCNVIIACLFLYFCILYKFFISGEGKYDVRVMTYLVKLPNVIQWDPNT